MKKDNKKMLINNFVDKASAIKQMKQLDAEVTTNYNKITKLKQVRNKSARIDQDIESLYRQNYSLNRKKTKLMSKYGLR